VFGSRMVKGLAVVVELCEKFPRRSRAVGTSTFLAAVGASWSCHSSLQKKNSLFFFGNSFGM